MAATATSGRERVRTLNDLLRRHHVGGQVVLTPGVLALGLDLLMLIDDAVSRFEAFTPDNDPYGEHDFGLVRVQGHVVLFKIDARLRKPEARTGHGCCASPPQAVRSSPPPLPLDCVWERRRGAVLRQAKSGHLALLRRAHPASVAEAGSKSPSAPNGAALPGRPTQMILP